MVLGGGSTGAALANATALDALSFTGSELTGRAVRLAAAANNVRVQTEMGGVNGLIVLADADKDKAVDCIRSEEHTSELQSLMRISYAVFCLKKKKILQVNTNTYTHKSAQV